MGRDYRARAIASPTCLLAMTTAACVSICRGDALWGVAVCLAVAVVAAIASEFRGIRCRLDAATGRRTRTRRATMRFEQLSAISEARQKQYFKLRNAIEEVSYIDPAILEPMDLDDLLDRFVRIADRHRRCVALGGERVAESLAEQLDTIADFVALVQSVAAHRQISCAPRAGCVT